MSTTSEHERLNEQEAAQSPAGSRYAEMHRRQAEWLSSMAEGSPTEARDALRDYCRTASRLPSYSTANLMLVAMQHPGATHLKGMRGWNRAGRKVCKGEHAIRIWAPIQPKANEDVDEESREAGDEQSRKASGQRLRFRLVNVFDVSQTEGEPLNDSALLLPESAEARRELLEEAIRPGEPSGSLVRWLKGRVTEELLDRGLLGDIAWAVADRFGVSLDTEAGVLRLPQMPEGDRDEAGNPLIDLLDRVRAEIANQVILLEQSVASLLQAGWEPGRTSEAPGQSEESVAEAVTAYDLDIQF